MIHSFYLSKTLILVNWHVISIVFDFHISTAIYDSKWNINVWLSGAVQWIDNSYNWVMMLITTSAINFDLEIGSLKTVRCCSTYTCFGSSWNPQFYFYPIIVYRRALFTLLDERKENFNLATRRRMTQLTSLYVKEFLF